MWPLDSRAEEWWFMLLYLPIWWLMDISVSLGGLRGRWLLNASPYQEFLDNLILSTLWKPVYKARSVNTWISKLWKCGRTWLACTCKGCWANTFGNIVVCILSGWGLVWVQMTNAERIQEVKYYPFKQSTSPHPWRLLCNNIYCLQCYRK